MIKTFPVNPYLVNTYIIWDETKECVLIDVAPQVKREETEIMDFIQSEELIPKHIVFTHPHVDHVCGGVFAYKSFGLPLEIHPDAKSAMKRIQDQASYLNFMVAGIDKVPRLFLSPGTTIHYGNSTLETVDTGGHANGSLSFISHSERCVFTGDALFRQSIGRTDFADGDLELLLSNLYTKIFTLPKDYIVYPGHGPQTSINDEIRGNPFLSF